MPPRTRTTSKNTEAKLIDVGGVEVTADDITKAIDVLTAAKGIMVRQPLATAGHPLATCDYHAVAAEQRTVSLQASANTKPMFISALERLAAEG